MLYDIVRPDCKGDSVQIVIYQIGRTKAEFVKLAQQEYLKRLSRAWSVKLEELTLKTPKSIEPKLQMQHEAKELLGRIKPQQYLIALDEGGKQLASPQLASQLEQLAVDGHSQLVFAIGGPHGFDKSVLARAQACLSLSKLTFTYQFASLILIEQLYRSLCIIKGVPYHKD